MSPALSAASANTSAVQLKPYFTDTDDPFEGVEWDRRRAVIQNTDGSVVFEMDDVEVPASWSQRATDIVVSKYFRKGGVPETRTEKSVRQVVHRIASALASSGQQQGYFSATTARVFYRELAYLLVNQVGCFNSPVLFNVGLAEIYGIKGESAGNWAWVESLNEAVQTSDGYSRPQSSACQPYHSLVLTERGLMPIGRIVEENAVGLRVHDGAGWTEVKATKDNNTKLVYKIQLADGRQVEATADHLVCAHTQRRKKTEEWVPVGDLQPGMYMRACVKAEEAAWDTRTASVADVAKAALAGWLQTDGYVGQPESAASLIVEFETINEQERNWVLQHLPVVFGDAHYNVIDVETDDPKVDYKRIRLYGEHLRPFVDDYGLMVRNPSQVVPQRVLTGTPTEQVAYLRSVFQADGYVSLRRSAALVAVSKCSRKMMQGVQQILARLGVYARLRRAEEKRAGRHDRWVVAIANLSERERFADLIGFIAADKQAKLDESLDLDGKTCPPVRYVPVESIACVGERRVYDIQTGTGKYLCGDVLVHNCFIRSVEDDLMSIAEGIKTEMRLFKWGSGTGTNFSRLRALGEPLSGGGSSSGVMSFLRAYDTAAGSVKSGGTTRRAAKMVILDADHPDVERFIDWKVQEEKKAKVLLAAGFSGGIDGEAYRTVSGQNANNTVRVTDGFMRAAEKGESWSTRFRTSGEVATKLEARRLLRKIASAVWECGDPGIQFHDTINRWNPTPNAGEIRATNPCVSGDTLVATADGLLPIRDLVGRAPRVVTTEGEQVATDVFSTGHKPVYRLRTKSGYSLKVTADHPIWAADRNCYVKAADLKPGNKLQLVEGRFGQESLPPALAEAIGYAIGDGCISGGVLMLTAGREGADFLGAVVETLNRHKQRLAAKSGDGRTGRPVSVVEVPTGWRVATEALEVVSMFSAHGVLDRGSEHKALTDLALRLDSPSIAALLRGLFTADGTVSCDGPGGKNAYVGLDSTSIKLLRQVQVVLLGFGIKSKLYLNRGGDDTKAMPDGRGGLKDYETKPRHSLRISRSSRVVFEQRIGFSPMSRRQGALEEMNQTVGAYADKMIDAFEELEPLGTEEVFDLRVPAAAQFVANGVHVHNCGEYGFVDESACNLASLNLVKFLRPDGSFDTESFRRACRIFILAQEIIVDYASYPTKKIAENSHQLRPLGLGYANLGGLLMRLGLPYDSDDGRAVCSAVTALMGGTAWEMSAEIAAKVGSFAGFPFNRDSMLRVGKMHQDALDDLPQCPIRDEAKLTWERALDLGREHGFRNAQLSLLAPTGTISFLMDCDTTGIEPTFALITQKKLAGGGMMKITSGAVIEALQTLGYSPDEQRAVAEYIDDNGKIEDAPHVKPEHYPVFACATGSNAISPAGHLGMMAAAQPYLCGGISKTCNLPETATVEDIERLYMDAWKMGLKAVAVFRAGSKGCQVLTSGRKKRQPDEPEAEKAQDEQVRARRRRHRLPKRRTGFTQEATIGGHKVYLRTGEYEDGSLGEIFIDMHKEGATLRSLLNTVAISISLGLQHGVPLEEYVDAFTWTRFLPAGPVVGHEHVKTATSIIDYIFKVLAVEYLGRHVVCQHCRSEFTATDPATARLGEMEESNRLLRRADELLASAPEAKLERRSFPR